LRNVGTPYRSISASSVVTSTSTWPVVSRWPPHQSRFKVDSPGSFAIWRIARPGVLPIADGTGWNRGLPLKYAINSR
jgi:hypothetical protein